jgi:hypothetical protein
MKRLAKLIEEMDNLLGHIEGINDERDSVPLLLEIRRRWPQIKADNRGHRLAESAAPRRRGPTSLAAATILAATRK